MSRVDEKPRYVDQTKNVILYRALKSSNIFVQQIVRKLCKMDIKMTAILFEMDYLEEELFLNGYYDEEDLPGINVNSENYLLDQKIRDFGKNFRSKSPEFFERQMINFCELLKKLDPSYVTMDQNGIFDMLYYMRTTLIYSERKDAFEKGKKTALEILKAQGPGIKTDPVGLPASVKRMRFFKSTYPQFESCYEWEQFCKSLLLRSRTQWVKFCMLSDMGVARMEGMPMYDRANAADIMDKYRIMTNLPNNIGTHLKVYNYSGLILVFWEEKKHLIILDQSSCDRLRAYSTSFTNFIVYWRDFRQHGDPNIYPVDTCLKKALSYLNKYTDPCYGNERDTLARHLHLSFTRFQNMLGEKDAKITCGWEERDVSLKEEVEKVFPKNDEWFSLCMSFKDSLGERVLYDFMKIYHLLPSPDIDHLKLHENVVGNGPSGTGYDSVFLKKFISFSKSFLLCNMIYQDKKVPSHQTEGEIDITTKTWYKKCMSGEFTLPPQEDWGKAWVRKNFDYQYTMEFHTLTAQDVTRVVRDKTKYTDRKNTLELTRLDSNEILNAIFNGSTMSNGDQPSEWRQRYFSDNSIGENVAVIAGKAENTKPGGVSSHPLKTRETLSADDCSREILSEMDANLKQISKYVPGCSQRRDMQQHKEKFYGIAKSLVVHPYYVCAALSGDIEKWSPHMLREVHSAVQEMFLEMTTCPNPKKAARIWENLTFITDRRGLKREGHYKYGTVQGWHATLDTLFHCLILVYFVYDCLEQGIMSKKDAAQNLAMIDDALTKFRIAGNPRSARNKIMRAKELLTGTYLKLGLKLDPVKTFVSTIKFVYLNEAYMDGAQVYTASKIFMRMDKDHARRLSTLPDNMETIMSIAANSSQGGCDPLLAYSFALWRCVMLVFERKSLYFLQKCSTQQLSAILLAPVSINGFGIRTLVQTHTSGAMDQLAWYTEMARSACLVLETKSNGKYMVAMLSQEPNYPSAQAMAHNPFGYTVSTHVSSQRKIIDTFLSSAIERGLAQPFKSMVDCYESCDLEDVWEDLLSNNFYDAALLEEVTSNLPSSFLDKVLKRITGSETVAALLPYRKVVVLKNAVAQADKHNLSVAYDVVNSRMKTSLWEEKIDLLLRGGSYSFTHGLRQRVLDELGYKIMHHTYPCPFSILASKGVILPDAERGRGIVTVTFESSRLSSTAGSQCINLYDSLTKIGGYRSYKSARAIKSTEKKNLIVDPVMECLCNGTSALKWAKDSGLAYTELASLFTRCWSGETKLELLDLEFEEHLGSCRRLSRRRMRLNHSVMAFPNTFGAYRVNLAAMNYLLSDRKFMLNQMNLLVSLKMTCIIHALMYPSIADLSFMICFQIKPSESGTIMEPYMLEGECSLLKDLAVLPFVEWDTEFKKYAQLAFDPLKMKSIMSKYLESGIEEAHAAYNDFLTEFMYEEMGLDPYENIEEDMIDTGLATEEVKKGKRHMDKQDKTEKGEFETCVMTPNEIKQCFIAINPPRKPRSKAIVSEYRKTSIPPPSDSTRSFTPKTHSDSCVRLLMTNMVTALNSESAQALLQLEKLYKRRNVPYEGEEAMVLVNKIWQLLPLKQSNIAEILTYLKSRVGEIEYKDQVTYMFQQLGMTGLRMRESNVDVTQSVNSFLNRSENKSILIGKLSTEVRRLKKSESEQYNLFKIYNLHTGKKNEIQTCVKLMKANYTVAIERYKNSSDWYLQSSQNAEDLLEKERLLAIHLNKKYKAKVLKLLSKSLIEFGYIDASAVFVKLKDFFIKVMEEITGLLDVEISEDFCQMLLSSKVEDLDDILELFKMASLRVPHSGWEAGSEAVKEVYAFFMADVEKTPIIPIFPKKVRSRQGSSSSKTSEFHSKREHISEEALDINEELERELEKLSFGEGICQSAGVANSSPGTIMSYLYETHSEKIQSLAGQSKMYVKEYYDKVTNDRLTWRIFLNEYFPDLLELVPVECEYFDEPEWSYSKGELVERF
nr:MAG: RNA-dependent RNA polymerase [brine shrimp qin-like virus 2]